MKHKSICIYGLGDYGLETYFKLLENKIKIDFFSDRSLEKQGYALDGLYCVSYDMLLQEDKQNCVVIVAIKNPEKLIYNFEQEGFRYVYDKETACSLLRNESERDSSCTLQYDPVQDIEAVKGMKSALQNAVYHNRQEKCELIQGVLSDYFKRTSGRKQDEYIRD